MKIVKIKAYKFEELNDCAVVKALTWLDNSPLDYEDDNGEIKFEYFGDIYYEDPECVYEHCEANEYLFDKYGNIIPHLIEQ